MEKPTGAVFQELHKRFILQPCDERVWEAYRLASLPVVKIGKRITGGLYRLDDLRQFDPWLHKRFTSRSISYIFARFHRGTGHYAPL